MRVTNVYFRKLLLVAAVIAGWTGIARAETAPAFPKQPENWLNCQPLTTEMLAGKGVLLWFFESKCPTCRKKWPAMLETAKKYEGKPVLFIAVSSGTKRADIMAYVQQTGVTWPIILDPDRSYEKSAGVPTISLQNIHQLKTIAPDGEIRSGNSDDLDGTIQQLLATATWKVDPADIPSDLHSAWMAVEFGNPSAGAKLIRKSLKSKKSSIHAAAEKLNSFVQEQIAKQALVAQAARKKGDKLAEYQVYEAIVHRFAGYEIPAEVEANRKELATDPEVKALAQAGKDLAVAKRMIEARSTAVRKKGTTMLEKIVRQSPDSDVGREASELLMPRAETATGNE